MIGTKIGLSEVAAYQIQYKEAQHINMQHC